MLECQLLPVELIMQDQYISVPVNCIQNSDSSHIINLSKVSSVFAILSNHDNLITDTSLYGYRSTLVV